MKDEQKSGLVGEASIIICPQAGNLLTKSMKNICKNFLKDANIDVKVVTRGGNKMTREKGRVWTKSVYGVYKRGKRRL